MDAILDWLNNPLNKTVLLFVGGLILKRWPAFVNKAIPIALAVTSALLSALASMFPAIVPTAHAAGGALADTVATSTQASAAGAPVIGWLAGVFVPVLAAIGTHSGGRALAQWADVGFRVFGAIRGKAPASGA